MAKKRSFKRALIMAILSMVVCLSMFAGTTFAWFTDSVTSSNNVIKAGNLDVELYYQQEGQSGWTQVTSDTNVFMKDALWEPGHTEVVKLKVVNEGSLALKYQLGVHVASEVGSTNVNEEAFKLSDFIKYGIVDGAQTYTRDQAIEAVDATATALNTDYNSDVIKLLAKEEKIVTMVVYMPTTVDNEANAKKDAPVPTINLGLDLFATQVEAESDSFGDQYDKDAWHPDFTVTSVEELAVALANGGKIQVSGTLNAGATQDVPNWTNAPAEFIFDATTLDALKGGKYVLEQGSRYGVVGLISAGESLALSD
ncbi:MAG: hypothetical protein E7353_07245, partial [Clostridiales bacterium]|nr:hypothetical protein [Clostridiales bacterium]